MRPLVLISVCVLFAAATPAAGQPTGIQTWQADSLSKKPSVLDSLRQPQDSVRLRDTLTAKRDTGRSISGIDTVVKYTSRDSIVFDVPTRVMSMYNKGDIRFRQMSLKANRIDIDWSTSVMNAFGTPDSADTLHGGMAGTPVMKDAGEEYQGRDLGYNFKSKKGRIRVADTKMDQGYYHGDKLKRVAPDVLFVADGRYTTCDRPDPHFYFMSPEMKVTFQDKVIAEPVYMYIADVPVFWLPLAVFPNKAGRRSGIIAPAIAEDATHGRLLRHLGYYWAISDYMDLGAKTDLYTKGSWGVYSDFRYALRYNFTGSFSGNYRKFISGEPSDPGRSESESYYANWTHSQTFNPTMSMNANFSFASQNSFRNTIDVNEALNQTLESNATLSKSWEGTSNSMYINVSRSQNLIDGSISEVLPSISFNHGTTYPFRFGKRSSDASSLRWYEMIGVSYSAGADNRWAKAVRSIDTIKFVSNGIDTLGSVTDYEIDRSQSFHQTVGIGIAPKVGNITISPRFGYSETRSFSSNDVPVRNAADSSVVVRNDRLSTRSGSVSTGVGLSTRLYGIIQPNMLGVQAFRHTLSPSLSLTYSKQVVGPTLQKGQMSAGLDISNVFEMKAVPEKEGKEPAKYQLLTFNAGVGYNFSADSLNFSAISTSFNTGLGEILNVGGSASFDMYKQDPVTHNDVNKLLITEEHRLARLTNFSINLSTTLVGQRRAGGPSSGSGDTTAPKPSSGYYGMYREEEPDFSIPWRLNLSLDYGESKVQPYPSRNMSVRGMLDFNLTENWKVTFNTSYDVISREFLYPNLHITRDLHCWTMDFSWVPIGTIRSYQFEIRLKAPQLKDIKLTKQGSDSGIYGP